MQVIKCVPPRGNWKNIPESVPSQRLAQIRESYKAGNIRIIHPVILCTVARLTEKLKFRPMTETERYGSNMICTAWTRMMSAVSFVCAMLLFHVGIRVYKAHQLIGCDPVAIAPVFKRSSVGRIRCEVFL